MMMNILQQEDLIKGAPDDVLLQEAQAPSGIMPQFLVISEIQRRQDMRQRFAAEEEQPQQTVAEQIVSESSPQQQGIAALPPQMPPQAPMGAMPPQMPPPQMPPQMMPPPQMPPEMMAAQMPPMAPQPQQVMMAGGGPIPNAIIEDASKFSPESLYDVSPMQQSAMLNATNMGIPSVLPMAGGGVVNMGIGGYLSAKEGWIPDRYQDEGKGIGSLDYSQIGSDALTGAELAALAMMLAPEPTSSIAGGVLKAGTTVVRAFPKSLQLAKTIPSRVKALPDQVRAYLARPDVAKRQLGKRLAALLGIGAIEGSRRMGRGDVIRQVEADQRQVEAEQRREDPGRQEVIDLIRQYTAGKSSGGVVKMQSGRTAELGMSDEEIALALDEMDRLGVIPPEMDVSRWIDPDGAGETVSSNFVSDVALGKADITDPALGRSFFGSVKDPGVVPKEVVPKEVVPKEVVQQSYSQSLIDMISERSRNIEALLGRQKELPSPDYEALKASLTEGVDDDATASILMSIGKSIAEGKGLAGADISQAQAIRQKAKDAMNALTLAESRGASEREIAAFDRELNTQLALLSAIPSPPNPLAGMTQLEKLHYYRDTLSEGEDREAVENLIARMTDESIQDILAELVVLQGGIESYNPETGEFTTVIGMDALTPGQQVQWNAAKDIGALEQLINERVAESFGTP